MNCSDVTAAEVDEEVRKVLQESYDEAKRLLTEHRKALDQIAEFLIKKETISGKEFMEIFDQVEKEDQPESASEAAEAETEISRNVPAPETIENKEDTTV